MKTKIQKKSLIFRDDAKKIEKESKNFDSITLDFSNVEFMSRSFVDELLNVTNKNKQNKIKIINLKLPLRKFLQKVKKTKQALNS